MTKRRLSQQGASIILAVIILTLGALTNFSAGESSLSQVPSAKSCSSQKTTNIGVHNIKYGLETDGAEVC